MCIYRIADHPFVSLVQSPQYLVVPTSWSRPSLSSSTPSQACSLSPMPTYPRWALCMPTVRTSLACHFSMQMVGTTIHEGSYLVSNDEAGVALLGNGHPEGVSTAANLSCEQSWASTSTFPVHLADISQSTSTTPQPRSSPTQTTPPWQAIGPPLFSTSTQRPAPLTLLAL
jgi:hypothetical protein